MENRDKPLAAAGSGKTHLEESRARRAEDFQRLEQSARERRFEEFTKRTVAPCEGCGCLVIARRDGAASWCLRCGKERAERAAAEQSLPDDGPRIERLRHLLRALTGQMRKVQAAAKAEADDARRLRDVLRDMSAPAGDDWAWSGDDVDREALTGFSEGAVIRIRAGELRRLLDGRPPMPRHVRPCSTCGWGRREADAGAEVGHRYWCTHRAAGRGGILTGEHWQADAPRWCPVMAKAEEDCHG